MENEIKSEQENETGKIEDVKSEHHHHHESGESEHHHHHHHHHRHHHEGGEGTSDTASAAVTKGSTESGKSEHHHHHHHHHKDGETGHHEHHREQSATAGETGETPKKKHRYIPQAKSDYRPGVERLRHVLMFLMCFYLFGFKEIEDFTWILFGFVPIAFFMLSGYLVLGDEKHRLERIVRSIKRTAATFGVLTAVYIAINCMFYLLAGQPGIIIEALFSGRFWFNFLVMNIWSLDIGNAIWYVQAMLYGYIILYFLEKRKLLKHDGIIAAVLIAFTVFTGEFSGIIPWDIGGYSYLQGNFLTRALPYLLVGGILYRVKDKLAKYRNLWYYSAMAIGYILIALELILFTKLNTVGYYGHMLGMPVIAAAVCMLYLKNEKKEGFEKPLKMSRKHINCIYYFCQPVAILGTYVLSLASAQIMASFIPYTAFIVYLVSFGIAYLISRIDRALNNKKTNV